MKRWGIKIRCLLKFGDNKLLFASVIVTLLKEFIACENHTNGG